MNITRKYKEIEEYSMLAQIYDYIMRHVNYKEWAKYTNTILKSNGIDFGRVVDISCGTGTFLNELKKYGYELYGSDNSKYMINQAKLKYSNSGINFYVMDMKNLTFKNRFDAVISLFDSINYLIQEEEILECLYSVESILEDNGLFIFDICTEKNSLSNFDGYSEKDEIKRTFYYRKSYYIKEERIQVNNFKIIDKKSGNNYIEIHKQRIYYPEEIEEIVKKSPFKLKRIYDDLTFNPPSNKTERIHFVLKKD